MVRKEQAAPVLMPVHNRKIPSIVVCPPTPEPVETITVEPPLTIVPDKSLSQAMKQNSLKDTENPPSLKVRYGPHSFYADVENGKYCINCEKRHQSVCVHEVVIGLKRGTTLTAHVSNKRCHALVDTDTPKSCSCMSLTFYEQLSLPPIKKLVSTTVQSATGSNLEPLGIVECPVKLGQRTFNNSIIVCHNMHQPLILGEDFLSNNALGYIMTNKRKGI